MCIDNIEHYYNMLYQYMYKTMYFIYVLLKVGSLNALEE